MPYSKQTFAYTTGPRTFTLALASGYDYESNIAVYVVGELTGGGDQIFRAFTFDSEFVINVTDALDNPSSVVVQRTVSPAVFSVDFEAGADVTSRNLQLAFRQQFFLMQEILDGRVDGVDITGEALNSATSAAESAADAAAAAADAIAAAASAASINVDDFVRKDGTTDFTATQIGVAPTTDLHLATKKYVDDTVGGGGSMLLDGSAQMTAAMLLVNAAPTTGNHATRKTYVDTADALKADIASPALTGNPTAPTQTVGNDSTRLATTEFVIDEIAAGGANAFASALFHIRDRKSELVQGGDFTAGAWRRRDINLIVTNEIGASLSNDLITLPAGTYYVDGSSPAYRISGHKCRLWNQSEGVIEMEGTTEYAQDTDDQNTRSFVTGRFTLAAEKTFYWQHISSKSKNLYGFGRAKVTSGNEIFTDIRFWKVG